jgi:hypothetical protein
MRGEEKITNQPTKKNKVVNILGFQAIDFIRSME